MIPVINKKEIGVKLRKIMDEMICGNRKKYVYQPKTSQEKRLYAYYVELNKRAA